MKLIENIYYVILIPALLCVGFGVHYIFDSEKTAAVVERELSPALQARELQTQEKMADVLDGIKSYSNELCLNNATTLHLVGDTLFIYNYKYDIGNTTILYGYYQYVLIKYDVKKIVFEGKEKYSFDI